MLWMRVAQHDYARGVLSGIVDGFELLTIASDQYHGAHSVENHSAVATRIRSPAPREASMR